MGIYLVLASYVVLSSISAAQVPMQCSSPMQFITTYVGFNYCRSVFGIELNEKNHRNTDTNYSKCADNKLKNYYHFEVGTA